MNDIDIGKLTKKSYEKIENYMKNVDIEAKKIEDKYLIKPNFRVYKSKYYNNLNSKFAYATSVFINESYIPSALVLAKNLRLLNHKYPCVCMIQDKSYKVENGQIFQGVSDKGIQDLLELYDYVIGVDLLKVNNYVQSPYHFTNTYSNILYYVTKGQVLGLTMFEKVMYLDASSYIENNIDSVFRNYEKGVFLEDPEYQYSKVGIHGAFFMITPNKYYYHKHMLFVQDYKKYFNDLYFMRGVDELLIFYAVFPNWSNQLFNDHFACRKNYKRPYEGCDIYHFQHEKPFKNPNGDSNSNMMENIKKHYIYYDDWDRLVRLLLKSHSHLEFYFKHIKNFRQTEF